MKKKHILLIFFLLASPFGLHLYAFQIFPYIAEYIVMQDKDTMAFVQEHGFDHFYWQEQSFEVVGADDCVFTGRIGPFQFEMKYVEQRCGDERYEPYVYP